MGRQVEIMLRFPQIYPTGRQQLVTVIPFGSALAAGFVVVASEDVHRVRIRIYCNNGSLYDAVAVGGSGQLGDFFLRFRGHQIMAKKMEFEFVTFVTFVTLPFF